eukprot:8382679-Alexandrium_andersonii.AAC.1
MLRSLAQQINRTPAPTRAPWACSASTRALPTAGFDIEATGSAPSCGLGGARSSNASVASERTCTSTLKPGAA